MNKHLHCKPYIFSFFTSITITVALLGIDATCKAQVVQPEKEKLSIFNFNTKAVDGINKQYSKLQGNIEKHSQKMLERMKGKEAKLQKKLKGIDSTKAKELFTSDVEGQYAALQEKIKGKANFTTSNPYKDYIPGLDSVQTSLLFLQTDKTNLKSLSPDQLDQLKVLSSQVKELQGRMQQANDIEGFIKEREALLKEKLANSGVGKQLAGINKEAYYYQQRMNEYKALLNDKDKLKEKLLSTVRTLPAFQKFWQRNSMLAQLFPMPENLGTVAALQGLQTRSGVQSQITQAIGTSGSSNPQQYFQQQVSAAQTKINELKEKLLKATGSDQNTEMTMPDFKPNQQKTKTFFQRLEYGFNIQSEPGTSFLPTTTDFALKLGYKINDKSTAGVGAAYKMGWGTGFKDIRISSEGVGLRSYVDIKMKGSLWFSGGMEYNFMTSFTSLRTLYNVDAWQKSALAGITKKYKVGKKEGNLQLLYDFLHAQQIPQTQAVKFRVGWSF